MAIKNIKDNLKRLKDTDPVELAGQVNSWLQESGEALRLRIEDEVEKAVTKRGFVKRSEFLKLEARIAELEGGAKVKTKVKTKVKAKDKAKTGTGVAKKSSSKGMPPKRSQKRENHKKSNDKNGKGVKK